MRRRQTLDSFLHIPHHHWIHELLAAGTEKGFCLVWRFDSIADKNLGNGLRQAQRPCNMLYLLVLLQISREFPQKIHASSILFFIQKPRRLSRLARGRSGGSCRGTGAGHKPDPVFSGKPEKDGH
jgi:hypothetical protein